MAIVTVTVCNMINLQTLIEETVGREPGQAKSLWLVAAAICGSGLLVGLFTDLRFRIISAAVMLFAAPGLALLGPFGLLPFLLIPLGGMAYSGYRIMKIRNEWKPDVLAGCLLTLLIIYAAHKRLDMLFRIIGQPTDPDLGSYINLANTSTGWNTLFREPLYVWILKLVDALGGTLNTVMAQLTSLTTGLVAVAAIFQLCWCRMNLGVAVIAAWLYASERFMVYNSLRGLRDDAVVAVTLLFLNAGWHHLTGRVTWKTLTLWGVLGGASALLRLSSMSFAVGMIILTALYRFYRDIKSWKDRSMWLLPVILTIALMAPYLVHCKKTYNQPFFLANYNARFYANEEFGGRRPDFPTKEELAKDAYAGGVITPGEYVFKYHTLNEVIARTWKGFAKTFFGLNLRVAFTELGEKGFFGILSILNFIGITMLLFPKRIYLVIAILLFHAPMFFMAARPTFDPRLLNMASAFIYMSVAASIGVGFQYLFQYMVPKRDTAAYGVKTKPGISHRKPKDKQRSKQ